MHPSYRPNYSEQQCNSQQGYQQNQRRALPAPPPGQPAYPPPGTMPKLPNSPFPRPAQVPPITGSPPAKPPAILPAKQPQQPQQPQQTLPTSLPPRALPPQQRPIGGMRNPAPPARSPERPVSTANPAPVMPFSPLGSPRQEPITNTSNPTPVLPFSQLWRDDSPAQLSAPQFSLSDSPGTPGITFGGFKPISAGQASSSPAPLSPSISFGTFRTSQSSTAQDSTAASAAPLRMAPTQHAMNTPQASHPMNKASPTKVYSHPDKFRTVVKTQAYFIILKNDEGEAVDKTVNVFIVGEKGVGKKTFCSKALHIPAEVLSDLGAKPFSLIMKKNVDPEIRVVFRIFDGIISPSEYNEPDCVLFTYDSTSRHTFDQIVILFNDMKRNATKPFMSFLALGTKSDLKKEREVTEKVAGEFSKHFPHSLYATVSNQQTAEELSRPVLAALLSHGLTVESGELSRAIDQDDSITEQEKEKQKAKALKKSSAKYFEKEIEKLCHLKI